LFIFYASEVLFHQTLTDVITMEELVTQIPEGVYTSLPVYKGNLVLEFQGHLDRLKKSAIFMGFSFPEGESWIRNRVKKAIKISGFDECVVKLIAHPSVDNGIYIVVENYKPPPEVVFEKGVHASLAEQIYLKPEVKSTTKIIERQKLREKYPDAYEVLLYNQKFEILEGASSNFFAVVVGQLWTAGSKVLEGITRNLILEEAKKILPILFTAIKIDQINYLDEAFISSTSRGIIPVININGSRISTGKPGRITVALSKAYEKRKELELIAL